jgi:hypothetical protein
MITSQGLGVGALAGGALGRRKGLSIFSPKGDSALQAEGRNSTRVIGQAYAVEPGRRLVGPVIRDHQPIARRRIIVDARDAAERRTVNRQPLGNIIGAEKAQARRGLDLADQRQAKPEGRD